MNRPRTLLLDLDGTLLDVDMGRFLEAFFPLLAEGFGPRGRRPAIAAVLTEAARGMFTSRDPARTLDRVFLEACAPRLGRSVEQLRADLAAFHRGQFERLGRLVRPVPAARPCSSAPSRSAASSSSPRTRSSSSKRSGPACAGRGSRTCRSPS